jgi:hypothetical protein
MDLEFKKKIEERFKEIPEVLAGAIKASHWESIVFDIGRRHMLHVDEIGEIQNELILVLTGIVHPDEFRRIVISEIGIPEDKADVVIEEINQQVNEKIKDSLKSVMASQREVSADERVPTEGEILSSERNVLHASGIRLGDEPDPIPTIIIKEPITPVASEAKPVSLSTKPAESIEVVKPTVFKTRISPAEVSDAGKGFSDPYREPVE